MKRISNGLTAALFCWATLVFTPTAFAQNKYLHDWPDFQSRLQFRPSDSAAKAVLPDDVVIAPPDAGVPPELSRFSGIWYGWMGRDYVFDLKLAVEKIERRGDGFAATIVYAGASTHWKMEPFFYRIGGVFENGELRAMLPGGNAMTIYRYRDDGNLDAKWIRPAATNWATGIAKRQ